MDKRTHVALISKDMSANGISSVIMNYVRNMNQENFRFSILSGPPILETYKAECCALGVEVIELPSKLHSSFQYYWSLYRILSSRKYHIAHIHGNSATITLELLIAKFSGIHVRIAHSHNVTCNHIKVHNILHPLFSALYTHAFACSQIAGNWLFRNNDYTVIRNAFPVENFQFDPVVRSSIRSKLDLHGKFVILCVGRFNDQKNHTFLLKVFEAVAEEKPQAHLLLVGDGPNLEEIKSLISHHRYADQITYYGVTNHVEELYSASDLFLLPTKYEGLGIVFIEAQVNGLPVITSDRVPSEVCIGRRTTFLSLSDDISKWKEAVLSSEVIDRCDFFHKHYLEIEQYEIKKNTAFLEKLYSEMMR